MPPATLEAFVFDSILAGRLREAHTGADGQEQPSVPAFNLEGDFMGAPPNFPGL